MSDRFVLTVTVAGIMMLYIQTVLEIHRGGRRWDFWYVGQARKEQKRGRCF